MVLQMTKKNTNDYAFYSKPLKQVFDSLEELRAAEAKHFNELKAKEAKAAQKKADAEKVEEAFKALNAARKNYKADLTQLTQEYSEELARIKKAFELGKKDIHDKLAAAEDAYNIALKEFIAAHPEGYHVTLRDGDFETTISGSSKVQPVQPAKKVEAKNDKAVLDLFDLLFGF
jgi:chromosome segregation ATPase